MASSPTAEGFRLIFRRPSIPLAEIAWRWSFGAAAWFLGLMFLLEYADTLPVNTLDRLMLSTQQPVLILRAIHRIFEGSAFRFTKAGLVLALALIAAWAILASLGRAAVIGALISEVDDASSAKLQTPSLLILNLLQTAVTLGAVIAAIGSTLIASSAWASTRVSVGGAMRLWIAALFVIAVAWSNLNWFLSTSAIFATERRGALDAFASLVRLCVERPVEMGITGMWFGLIHFGAILFAFGAAFTVLAAGSAIGAGGVLFLEFLVLLTYSAVVDFLRVGRLGAYISIVHGGTEATLAEPAPPPAAPVQSSGTIDRSELILSDMPLPVS